jgi:hypothetical protein
MERVEKDRAGALASSAASDKKPVNGNAQPNDDEGDGRRPSDGDQASEKRGDPFAALEAEPDGIE